MKILEIHNYEMFNNQKKTIIAFMMEHIIDESNYAVNTKYFYNTLNILNKDFNIVLIAKNTSSKWVKIAEQNDLTKNFIYITFDNTERKYFTLSAAKMSHLEKHAYIIEGIKELESEYSELCKSFVGTINSSNTIPSLDLNIELLADGNNELMKKQQRASKRYKRIFSENRMINHNAFIHKPYGFGYTFIQYLMQNYTNMHHYCFAHAPNSLWIIYNDEFNPYTKNVKCFYHITQYKENRKFNEFPMAALQDYYMNNVEIKTLADYEKILDNKEIDLLFGGLFPPETPARVNAWYKYFNDLKLDNLKIRTQTNNSWKINSKKFSKDIEEDEPQILTDIKNHPKTTNTLPYDEYNLELMKSMFTIALECYPAKYDHFTLRFISALFFGCLPLITEEYDPNSLQVPERFRNKLLVKNPQDIEDKINYYKTHFDEYKELFREMWKYYLDERQINESYFSEEFKKNYFKELY